jgi:hypothetical protein
MDFRAITAVGLLAELVPLTGSLYPTISFEFHGPVLVSKE